MKAKNIFLLWLWANLMIGFWAGIFALTQEGPMNDGFIMCLVVFGIGFLFTIPSLIVLMVFHAFYSNKNSISSIIPYVLIIVFVNFLYFITYYFSYSYNFEMKWIAFFLLSTFCGLVALFIEHNKVKKSIPNIEIEQFPNDEIQ